MRAMSPIAEGYIGERRAAGRRTMPSEVRTLVRELEASSRQPGARTAEGVDWRTVELGVLLKTIEALRSCYRPLDEPLAASGAR